MTVLRLLSTLALTAAAGTCFGLSFATTGPKPRPGDGIAIGPAVRMETESMDFFGNVTKEPPVWHVEIRLSGSSAARERIVVTLSSDKAAGRRIDAGAVRRLSSFPERAVGPRAPRTSPSFTAYRDTLGSRLALVALVEERTAADGDMNPAVKVATLWMDSTTVQETGWIGVFDPDGTRLAGRPNEVRP